MSKKIPFNSILLIDDDLVSSFLNKRVIQDLKIADHTFLARNGGEAIDYLLSGCKICGTAGCPDLILLDLKMPVMNGFEFLKELQEIKVTTKRNYKIIIVSSSEDPRDCETLSNFSTDGYILKPLTKEKLLELV